MNATNLLDLRPLSIGELFDRTFRLFRKHFVTFVLIAVIMQLPLSMFQIMSTVLLDNMASAPFDQNPFLTQDFPTSTFLLSGGIIAAIAFFSFIVTQVGTAALTRAVADGYLGRKVSFDNAFSRMGNSWLTLVLAIFVTGFLLLGLSIPVFIGAIIPCLGFFIGLIGFFFIGAIGNILISLLPPIIVLEKGGVFDSIARAWVLSRLRFWWVIGYLILLGLLTTFIVIGPAAVIGFALSSVLIDLNIVLQSIIQQTLGLMLSAIFMPIRIAAITLMYFDLRIRFEGFDLMVLAKAGESASNNATDLPNQSLL